MGHWVRLLELSPARAAILPAHPWRLRVGFHQPAAADGIGALAHIFPKVRRERMVGALHTLERQSFEYRAAWPRLRPAGVPRGDDLDWNASSDTFCRETGSDDARTAGGRLGMTRRPGTAREH